MKRLLITGASGFLGWNLCAAAHKTWRVHAIVHMHPGSIPGAETHQCDLTDSAALKSLFSSVNPDAVIHAAAASQPDFCEKYPTESGIINVDASLAVAGLCAEKGIPCAFTSSDLVFDGTKAPYREGDPVSPISIYAGQKAAAEQGMRDRCPHVLICRMPLMFGNPGPHSKSFIQPWIEALRAGKELSLFADEFRTPVSGQTAAAGILQMLVTMPGVVHLGGRDRISRYDFGMLLARMMKKDASLIKRASQKDLPMIAPRPADVSLDSSYAYSLGYNPDSVEQELRTALASIKPT